MSIKVSNVIGSIDLYSLEGDFDSAIKRFSEILNTYQNDCLNKECTVPDKYKGSITINCSRLYLEVDGSDSDRTLLIMGEREENTHEQLKRIEQEHIAKVSRKNMFERLKKEFEGKYTKND